MSTALFNLDQVEQLNQIQRSRLRHGQPGIGNEVAALIARLTSGGVAGKTNDVREAQTKRYWDLGVGTALGLADFAAYLATVPEVPMELLQADAKFPFLVLVEPRLGLRKLCKLANILFNEDPEFVVLDEQMAGSKVPTWIRVEESRKNRDCNTHDPRRPFGSRKRQATALQGVCTVVQHANCVSDASLNDGRVMNLCVSHNRYHGKKADIHVLRGHTRLEMNLYEGS